MPVSQPQSGLRRRASAASHLDSTRWVCIPTLYFAPSLPRPFNNSKLQVGANRGVIIGFAYRFPACASRNRSVSRSDSSVATVSDSGKITAVASGSCSITLSSESGVSEYVYVDVLEDTYFTDSEAELAACGTWTSYGAYLNDEGVEYYGVELYLYSDNTGTLYHDGESIDFEWYYDFSDEEVHFYDAYTDDGGYFWFDYYYTGAYEGDLDVCLEDDFWILFER